MGDDFDAWNKSEWQKRLNQAFPKEIPTSASWDSPPEMASVLSHFCARNLNHMMLPLGGGMDILKVRYDDERNVLELWPDHRLAYQCRPQRLNFEYFQDSPVNSFFLLEAGVLEQSGVYGDLKGVGYEEVVELSDGRLVDRSCIDEGCLGYDEEGAQIPLPDNWRLLTRFFSGKFLLVAKRSIWNQVSATYDARHTKMSVGEIRRQIANVLSRWKD